MHDEFHNEGHATFFFLATLVTWRKKRMRRLKRKRRKMRARSK
ncbi:unnamed protein product [Tenebrio molitor]|nr:unnamed protein product [Tenebrio molitor]